MAGMTRDTIGTVQPGDVVFFQGHWRCEVVRDYGESIEYLAHEGAPRGGEPPRTWTAAKDLFTVTRDRSGDGRPVLQMTLDPWGVGFTVRAGRIHVHFPRRDAAGEVNYGVGIPVDHEPELARNGIRAELFRHILAEG